MAILMNRAESAATIAATPSPRRGSRSRARIAAAVATVAILAAIPTAAAQEAEADEVFERYQNGAYALFERASNAVVGIQAQRSRGRQQTGFGAGFVIDTNRKLIVSSTDVVASSTRQVTIRFADHTTSRAGVVARDESTNAVLLVADNMPASAVALAFADSDAVRVGDLSMTLGNPYQSIMRVGEVSFSVGVVSGRYTVRGNAKYSGEVLEVDAAVNPGSYGGPLIDVEGRVIGMAGDSYSHSRWLGTAVPSNAVRTWLDGVLGEVTPEVAPERGYLGLVLADHADGVRIQSFIAGSPGESTELKVGDVIVRVGPIRMTSKEDWERYVANKESGQRILLIVMRGGEIKRIEVVLGSRFM